MLYRRAVVLVALALVFVLAVPLVSAQDSLEVTVNASDSSFSFRLPAGWLALEGDNNTYLAANSQAAFENIIGENGGPQPGDLLVLVIGPQATVDEFGAEAGMDLATLGDRVEEGIASDLPLTFGESEILPAPDGRQAVFAITTEDSEAGGLYIMFDDGSGQFVGMVVLGSPDDLESDIVGEIVFSLQLGAAETAAESLESAELVWSVADVFKNIDGSITISNDQIYVTDGLGDILIFSLDGEQIGTIASEDMSAPTSLAVTEDGNFWVADGFGKTAWLITPEGEALNSFGGEEVFSGFSPDFVAIGPDGSLYLTDDRDGITWMQVWSTEGEFVREFQVGDADSFIWTMDMGPDGNLYVVDLVGGVMVYDLEGTLVNESFAASETFLQFISGFAALPDGTFFLAAQVIEGEGEVYTLVHLDADGHAIGRFTAADLGLETLYSPADFALTPDGDVIVTDVNADGSQIFRIALTPAGE